MLFRIVRIGSNSRGLVVPKDILRRMGIDPQSDGKVLLDGSLTPSGALVLQLSNPQAHLTSAGEIEDSEVVEVMTDQAAPAEGSGEKQLIPAIASGKGLESCNEDAFFGSTEPVLSHPLISTPLADRQRFFGGRALSYEVKLGPEGGTITIVVYHNNTQLKAEIARNRDNPAYFIRARGIAETEFIRARRWLGFLARAWGDYLGAGAFTIEGV